MEDKIVLSENLKIALSDISEIILVKGNGRCDKIIFEMPEISLDKIDKAYNGKPGCMCGCLGNYTYINPGENRDCEKKSSQSVNFVLNKLKNEAKRGIEVIGDYIYLLDIEDRRYALYLFN